MIGRVLVWPLKALMLVLIAIYRYGLTWMLPKTCRFAPSCSEYAQEAIVKHGPIRGGWLALRRIVRCHPWGGSGFDPVP